MNFKPKRTISRVAAVHRSDYMPCNAMRSFECYARAVFGDSRLQCLKKTQSPKTYVSKNVLQAMI